MKSATIRFVQSFLHRPDLKISEKVPTSYFVRIVWQRGWMLLRGTVKGILWGKHGNQLYIGKGTQFFCAKMIFAGSGVSVQDGVIINALSINGVVLGNNCSIGMRSIIRTSGSLSEIGKGFRLGDYSTMGNDCFVGAAGGVEIGEHVAMGQNIRFHSENHVFADTTRPIYEQGVTHDRVRIMV